MKEFRIKTGDKIPFLSSVGSKNDVLLQKHLHKLVLERRNCPKRSTSRFATLLTQSSKDKTTERSNEEAFDVKSKKVNEGKENLEGLRKDAGSGSSFDETLSSLDALLEQTAVQDENGDAFNLTESAAPDLPKTGRHSDLENFHLCLQLYDFHMGKKIQHTVTINEH